MRQHITDPFFGDVSEEIVKAGDEHFGDKAGVSETEGPAQRVEMTAARLLELYDAQTDALPHGAGSPVGWSSRYNAQKAVIAELRKLAASE